MSFSQAPLTARFSQAPPLQQACWALAVSSNVFFAEIFCPGTVRSILQTPMLVFAGSSAMTRAGGRKVAEGDILSWVSWRVYF